MLDEISARCYSSACVCLTVVGAIHNMSSSVTPDTGSDSLFVVLYCFNLWLATSVVE